MKIKVCGILNPEAYDLIKKLPIDFIGLNFHPSSARYVDQKSSKFFASSDHFLKVGVFVHQTIDQTLRLADDFRLDYIQLHGDHQEGFIKKIAQYYPVIKVFRIQKESDFKTINGFNEASYFLIDFKTVEYGGSGKQFDWNFLESYNSEKSFFLAGGIGPKDYQKIMTINHPKLYGLDLNSKFESKPGYKDHDLLYNFTKQLKIAI